jgi:hypothetical protein
MPDLSSGQSVPLLAITGSPQVYAPTSPLRAWHTAGEDEIVFPLIQARSFYCGDAAHNILKLSRMRTCARRLQEPRARLRCSM